MNREKRGNVWVESVKDFLRKKLKNQDLYRKGMKGQPTAK